MMERLQSLLLKMPIADSDEEAASAAQQFYCFDGGTELPCPICSGRGWYSEGGELFKCPNYSPARDTRRQEHYQKSVQLNEGKTFDSFNTEPDALRRAYTNVEMNALKDVKSAAKAFSKDPRGWLVLQGKPGCGKTHLANAVALEVLKNLGMGVMFTTGVDLLDKMRASFNDKSSIDAGNIIQSAQNAELLVLDDYGAESPTKWVQEKMFQVLNHRHANNKPTIITTNLTLDDMPPRIKSRMQESEVVNFIRIFAPDYRESTSKIKRERHENESVLRYKGMTFDTWWGDVEGGEDAEKLLWAKVVAQRWAKNPKEVPFLYIFGNHGVGKTHLAYAIANSLKNKSSIEFITVSDLSQKIHSAMGRNASEMLDEIISVYADCEYLILDDFDIAGRRFSRWSMMIIFDIVDKRMLHGRPTVITSPLPIEMLDERWRVRLSNRSKCYELNVEAGKVLWD